MDLGRKTIIVPILLFTFALAAALAAEDITTNDGKLYKNATITAATPAHVSISYEDGLARELLQNLPEDLQKRYGYDPEKAAEHLNAEAEAQMEAARKRQIESVVAEIEKAAVFVEGTILQVLKDGASFQGTAYRFDTTEISTRLSDGTTSRSSETEKIFVGEMKRIFIVGDFHGLVDGDQWEGKIWPAGSFSFQSVGHGVKTIPQWATTLEVAVIRRTR